MQPNEEAAAQPLNIIKKHIAPSAGRLQRATIADCGFTERLWHSGQPFLHLGQQG